MLAPAARPVGDVAVLPQPSGQWGYRQADNQAQSEGQGKGWEV